MYDTYTLKEILQLNEEKLDFKLCNRCSLKPDLTRV